ncbi:twin-arginine translocation signal domain-containing protein, partial [Thermodesulfobacteriota bacterium]
MAKSDLNKKRLGFDEDNKINRREFLAGTAAVTASLAIPG